MVEQWKDFDYGYQVSNLGRIKKLKLKRKNIEKIKNGTKRVYSARYLSFMMEGQWLYVHIIVAQNFVTNKKPGVYTSIKHLNGNFTDNRAENLKWVHPQVISNKRKLSEKKLHTEEKTYRIKYKYEVLINKNNFEHNIGVFDSLEEARYAAIRFEKRY